MAKAEFDAFMADAFSREFDWYLQSNLVDGKCRG